MTCPSSQPPPRRPRRHLLSNGPKTNESLSAPPLEDPPGQAEVLAWIAREMRHQWRLDRLWILTVALPAKGLLLRYALRAPVDARRWFAAGAGVATLTIGTLRYLIRRPR